MEPKKKYTLNGIEYEIARDTWRRDQMLDAFTRKLYQGVTLGAQGADVLFSISTELLSDEFPETLATILTEAGVEWTKESVKARAEKFEYAPREFYSEVLADFFLSEIKKSLAVQTGKTPLQGKRNEPERGSKAKE